MIDAYYTKPIRTWECEISRYVLKEWGIEQSFREHRRRARRMLAYDEAFGVCRLEETPDPDTYRISINIHKRVICARAVECRGAQAHILSNEHANEYTSLVKAETEVIDLNYKMVVHGNTARGAVHENVLYYCYSWY